MARKSTGGGNKSGSRAGRSGQYERTGPRGGKGPEITMVKGKRFPPTKKPGEVFVLVDPTQHESDRE